MADAAMRAAGRPRLPAAMAAPASRSEILDVNRRYHDVAAARVRRQVGHLVRRERAGSRWSASSPSCSAPGPGPFARSLEIGAGTGYFSLNLLQAGVVGAATCTDISPGMLATLEANAARARARGRDGRLRRRRAAVRGRDASTSCSGTRCCTTCPSSSAAFAEFHRVLRPGGTLFFAGEPSRQGDRIAAYPKRVAWRLLPAWRARAARAAGAAPQRPSPAGGDGRRPRTSSPRSTCTRSCPADLERHAARRGLRAACRCAARSCWPTGSAGSTARSRPAPTRRGSRWPGSATPTAATCCCRASTGACSKAACPPQLFYNLMLAATKPAA